MFANWNRLFDSHVRLCDPEMKETMDRIDHKLRTDKVAAEQFLRSVGILPPIGPLEKPMRSR
ncbi:hypothetical protein [Luteibacter aegosomatissinici]|uniref:hypothetical protein n=1 Tax=Luteibacter aegosomatissinici TaxID=2911539 RepID=UPI001FF83B8E|nr:hypothetical protein [Luteibacter aegosomatissinici]UPG92609.1 hypothetical protein L2Y97_12085 [Luteibacter aegosomatissinici]